MSSAPILAIIVGLSVANLYYVQSLLPQIARDLGLTEAAVLTSRGMLNCSPSSVTVMPPSIGSGTGERTSSTP